MITFRVFYRGTFCSAVKIIDFFFSFSEAYSGNLDAWPIKTSGGSVGLSGLD